MYFRGDTELRDLDTRLLNRMPETALRCLGVMHRKGNDRKFAGIGESASFTASTIGRALAGGCKSFSPHSKDEKDRDVENQGPPLKLAAGVGAGLVIGTGALAGPAAAVAGASALALGAWVGATAVRERARI